MSGNRRIRVVDDANATDLVVTGGHCAGATFATTGERRGTVSAGAGRCSRLAVPGRSSRETTNPPSQLETGLPWRRARARVVDLEFVQFHPTVLSVEGSPRFLLSEGLAW